MRRPIYTPSSIIKKIFRPGERSLSREEIVGRLRDHVTISSEEEAENFLEEVLQLPGTPVRVGKTDAIIELTYTPDQLFDLAYRFLSESVKPRTMEQIVRELRKQTRFSWNQIARTLKLNRDPRFVQFVSDERWFLADWKVANDQVFEAARSREIHMLSVRMVRYFMEQEIGLSEKDHVFVPRLDDRFRVEEETLYINYPDSPDDVTTEPAETMLQELVQATAEVASTTTEQTENEQAVRTEEEWSMTTTQLQHVQTEVDRLLKQAVELLEVRNREMAEEVVGHFQQSNMSAIEVLLQEKQQNEQAVVDLKQVIVSLNQK